MLGKIIKILSIAILLVSILEARPSGKHADENTSSVISADEDNSSTQNSASETIEVRIKQKKRGGNIENAYGNVDYSVRFIKNNNWGSAGKKNGFSAQC